MTALLIQMGTDRYRITFVLRYDCADSSNTGTMDIGCSGVALRFLSGRVNTCDSIIGERE